MKPGATTRPEASIVLRAASFTSPTAAILEPEMATSARRPGAPVPSTTRPLRITRSCAMRRYDAAHETSRDPRRRAHPLRARERRLQRVLQPGHADGGAEGAGRA